MDIQIKELPILFSTPMVQAILEARKTQTRRIVKFRNKKWRLSYEANEKGRTDLDAFGVLDKNGNLIEIEEGMPGSLKELELCPYGKPGDLLWVRETWRPDLAGIGESEYAEYIKYAADGTRLPIKWVKDYDKFSNKPGIHMNKEYARIWLQVEDIRVERLQDISEEDAIAEGTQPSSHRCGGFGYYEAGGDIHDCVCQSWEANADVMGFKDLWCEINGADSWAANPFCWVIQFTVLSTTGKPIIQS